MTSGDIIPALTSSLREHDSILVLEGRSENLASAKMLTRLAGYTVVLAWVILGAIIILSQDEGVTPNIVKYFLSPEDSGMRFRALMLLAPLILTAIGFLINERAKLYQKTVYAEGELRLLLNSLVVAFANALDAKSSWTMGHSARV